MAACDFVPVLLGTEIGSYGLARSFWEEYEVESYAFGTFPLTPTANSRFITVVVDENFADDDHFVEVLNNNANLFGSKPALVVPCGDDYSLLLARNAHRLCTPYVPVCSSPQTLDALNNKESFYEFCERAGVPFPRSTTIGDASVPELPFDYPVVVKPTDAAQYREHPFEGQKKAFVISSEAVLEETLRRVYASGYEGRIVIQDFVPGDDSNMRVVNGYVSAGGKLTFLSAGQPILEDCAPMRIGNYAAIVALGQDEATGLYDLVQRLMDHVPYFGYFNLDLKYDSRTDTYQFLDFNPRLGRSAFFSTLAGCNIARFTVDDLVKGIEKPLVRGGDETLWVGVPKRIVRRYSAPGPQKDRALDLMKRGKVGTTLFGAKETNPKRLWTMSKLWLHYDLDFRRYFGKRELGE